MNAKQANAESYGDVKTAAAQIHQGQQAPVQIPGYRIERMLGTGLFGQVWSARGPGGARTALKIIPLSNRQSLREFRAVRRIREIGHAHLMPIVGLWLLDRQGELMDDSYSDDWDGNSVLTSNWLKSGQAEVDCESPRPAKLVEAMPLGEQDLAGRLKECKRAGEPGIPVAELLDYLEDAAKAIDFLNTPRHDLGEGPVAIHHGDIKPQNIMLVGGTAQVCDFSLATILGDSPSNSTEVAGSVAFLSPEVIRNKRPHATSDQYSLAITYVELRTGDLPFAVQTVPAVLQAHLDGNLDFSKLSPPERQVIQRATAANPHKRFASCVALVRALRAASRATLPGNADRDALCGTAFLETDGRAHDAIRSGHMVQPASDRPVTTAAIRRTKKIPAKSGCHYSVRNLLVVLTLAAWVIAGVSAIEMAKTPARADSPGESRNHPPLVRAVSVNSHRQSAMCLEIDAVDPEGSELEFEVRLGHANEWTRTSHSRFVVPQLPAGKYVVQVRAIDAHGSASSTTERHCTISSSKAASNHAQQAVDYPALAQSEFE